MTVTIEGSTGTPSTPSIDPDEVAKFSAMAADWWDPRGKFRPLHKFNPVRLRFIRETAEQHFGLATGLKEPLKDLRLLDIGCGGGLVCEPMTRLGATVTGVDASEKNIKTAMTHALEQGLDIDYRAGTAEGLIDGGEALFDIVLNLEVVEHVADPHQFLKDTASLVKPGGLMIVATLNRTAKALATAVVGAEYVLGWLPRGTHDWSKFVTPDEATAGLKAAGMDVEPATGVSYSPLSDSWKISSDTKVNYMIVARRPVE
ncbi:bifunctional 2-polyprenyl-6-hydroxyphenol methylase/3-demethylubiquinol 3-O-methyltransferase UbiG [Hyphomonas pacifica]|uniref:bifunctional 2-polyprenyl-6-hydroxyphenol methylase/3-demethylubiquinol 3-O-methyltransferase UbiG n=1 Tax=Hyphomonas pacifica TaxID=1280941 RepID=UPI000DBFC71A|nr:bifunctional 2-polyprenyl-6-hydroxyphenol methylase/3-demethylubiquinol 3-O-methyltransferase UbiG [Hyphomonas pacifica]RAN37305.1 3-demethylubiquinone-9 3-methyltransferase [Hyphomonas pacifica]